MIDLLTYHLTHHFYYPTLSENPHYIGVAILDGVFNDLTTTIVFAINQLSPSSISISPLATIHPRILQHSQVRSNYLMMAGSLGFGSNSWDSLFSFHTAYALLQAINLLTHYAIGK